MADDKLICGICGGEIEVVHTFVDCTVFTCEDCHAETRIFWDKRDRPKTEHEMLAIAAFRLATNREILESLVEDLRTNDMQSLEATLKHWAEINLPESEK